MKYKGERIAVYRIDFISVDGTDYGFELIEGHTVDEAIEIFRSYCSKEEYRISDVLKRIGMESGTEVWKDR